MSSRGAAVALALVIGAAGTARADDASDRDKQARELYYAGDNHYAAGRYEEALRNFERAYELSKRPQLLYNIANAYERMGEYEKAAAYLRRYLDSPEADDVSSVRERIKRLEMNAAARQRDGGDPAGAPITEQTTPPTFVVDGEVEPGGRAGSRRPAYLVFAGSGALFVTSVLFGLASQNAGSDAERLCNDDGLCPTSSDDALRREKRFAIVADVTAGVGLAAIGVGVYLLVRERRPEPARTVELSPTVSGDGVGLAVTGQF